jgi:hypothetical protein
MKLKEDYFCENLFNASASSLMKRVLNLRHRGNRKHVICSKDCCGEKKSFRTGKKVTPCATPNQSFEAAQGVFVRQLVSLANAYCSL